MDGEGWIGKERMECGGKRLERLGREGEREREREKEESSGGEDSGDRVL